MNGIILWSLLILPWASLLFLKMDTVRRYMPVALFMTVIHTLAYQAAYHYGWWEETGSSLFGWDKVIPVPWVYGAYLAIVIWVFRFTFGKLWLYLIVNVLLDGLFMYIVYPIWQRMGLVSSESTLPTIAVIAMMVGFALIIYLYQMWQDEVFKEPRAKHKNDQELNWRPLHRRKKAR
ncbi:MULTISPECIES: hypothetical protein [unclassified Paenibacillus]|uniref:hypothetical protein n=1 Tax=unclassified Paenibacillus TaxID=185978 RepID=UPI0027D7BA6D|nr:MULTISPECIES: hypothetical protein [unclassified Paenibacillus]